jgi:hypothetical protein
MSLSLEAIGEIDHIVGQWCLNRVPPPLKHKLDYDYEIDGQAVTLLEVRPVWRGPPGKTTRSPIARIRYVHVRGCWKIFWMRRNMKWIAYEPDPEARSLPEALAVIERDDYCCFFG